MENGTEDRGTCVCLPAACTDAHGVFSVRSFMSIPESQALQWSDVVSAHPASTVVVLIVFNVTKTRCFPLDLFPRAARSILLFLPAATGAGGFQESLLLGKRTSKVTTAACVYLGNAIFFFPINIFMQVPKCPLDLYVFIQ